ncbi:MAG: beta-propeller domain-containing protein [archaeon]|nr:MAG: beta-propeller domain-containing protein [archaeon]
MNKNIIPLAFVLIIIGALLGIIYFAVEPSTETYEETGDYKTFSSCQQMEEFINETTTGYGYGTWETLGVREGDMIAAPTQALAESAGATKSETVPDYSETNIQVEGVDEADIVKTDGSYIYVLSGKKLSIIDAYPAEDAEILSTLEFENNPQELFINRDKLVVFGSSSYPRPVPMVEEAVYGYISYTPSTFVYVYDVEDREDPELVRNVTIEGGYYDSRMIGDYVYVIANKNAERDKPVIPRIYTETEERPACNCIEVGYFNIPDSSYRFTTILSVNTQEDSEEVGSDVYLMGYSQNLYVSRDNIYLTSMKRMDYRQYQEKMIKEVVKPLLPLDVSIKLDQIMESDKEFYEKWGEVEELMQDYFNKLTAEEKERLTEEGEEKMEEFENRIAKEMEKTIIHKISIDKSEISYRAKGEVPGYVLNQFSMDEHDGYFRIATTTGSWRTEDYNHLYVLDSDLDIVGKLEDLAKGERIKSARFIGDRCYLVTFVQIDPLFVIDLSDPYEPEVLGELKVTGYSSYLHPYDENHLIGIGKETEEGKWGPIETGVKLALFDVSDVSNPEEVDKYVIGGGWASTPVMQDHKAFLFDRDKDLLVIPAQVSGRTLGFYTTWQGAYVFDLTLEDGFELKGTVSHEETKEESDEEEEYYYKYRSVWNNYVKRSLYIDDVLYTVSNRLVKMNELDDLEEIGEIGIS